MAKRSLYLNLHKQKFYQNYFVATKYFSEAHTLILLSGNIHELTYL